MNSTKKMTLSNPTKSIYVLFAANLMTLYGVVYLDWSSFEVVLVYCLESIVIGIFNIFKMIFASGGSNETILKFFLAPFFAVHYNGFMIVQFVFVFLLLEPTNALQREFSMTSFDSIAILGNGFLYGTLLSLILSHLFSFVFNYILQKEYLKVSVTELMVSPYKRVFIQQFVIIIGAFLLTAFNSPTVFVFLLVVLKIAVDGYIHLKSHKKLQTQLK